MDAGQGRSREPIPPSALRIGIKCGGSGGYSGITANPLVGRVSDRFGRAGATVLMTEIPEVFGTEEILLSRRIAFAEGEETRGEQNGYFDIAIFKDGVTL